MSVSRDPKVFIYPGSLLRRISQIIVALLIVSLLLLPVITITALKSGMLRITVAIVASAIFIITLSALTKAKTSEMFVAGAT